MLDRAQDTSSQQDIVNALIVYINTIIYGDNAALLALLKANNLSDLVSVPAALANLGIGTAGLKPISFFDLAGAAAAAQAAAIAASDPVGSAAAAQAAAEAASDPVGTAAAIGAGKADKGINADITALTALSITAKSTSYNIVAGDSLIEASAASGPISITYKSTVSGGRITVVKVDTTFNAVTVTDGASVSFALTSPKVGNFCQSVVAYNSSGTIHIF